MTTKETRFRLSTFSACLSALMPLALAGCGGETTTSDAANAPTGQGNATDAGDTTSSTGGGTSTASTAPTSNVKLNGAGASFPNPLYSRWIKDYKAQAGVNVNYEPSGSGAGIKSLKEQTVDFAGSDAPLSSKDRKGAPGELVQMPTCAGSVAVVYNLQGAPNNLKMNGDAIAGIYLGRITKWNDPALAKLNPGANLPARNIVVAHRSDGSGTTNIFTTYLSQVSSEWKSKVGSGKSVDWPVGQGGKGNDGVAANVKGQQGAIGYVELAYAKSPLLYASVQNKSGAYVVPSAESTQAAAEGGAAALAKDIAAPIINSPAPKAYPIASFTYLMTYKKPRDAAKGAELVKFLNYALTDGQKAATELDYAPLPASVVKLNQTTLATLGK